MAPQFDVEVFNEGSFGGQKHVGRGTAPLKTLITELNQHVSFVLPLSYYGKEGKNATGTSKGQIVVRGFIEGPPKVAKAAPEQPAAAAPAPVKATAPVPAPAPTVAESTKPVAVTAPEPATKPAAAATAPVVVAAPPAQASAPAPTATTPAPATATVVAKKEPASAAPLPLAPSADFDDTKRLKLRLTRLGLRDLKDTGGMFDKQDPALRITVGDNKPFETHRYRTKILCLLVLSSFLDGFTSLCCRIKDAGVNADFPETYELEIPAAHFTNNLSVRISFLSCLSLMYLTIKYCFGCRLSLRR